MAVPFSLGKVLDIIYSSSNNLTEAREKMNQLCGILITVFLIGAVCNFGRIYIMSTAGILILLLFYKYLINKF